MRTILLGDIHGRSIWKDIVAKEVFDKLVFIGDYFDSFDISGEQQCNNFLDIIAYNRANPGKVIMLIGNHDYHYLDLVSERYSGHQGKYHWQIKQLLEVNKGYLQIAYQINDTTLATHAGVSKTWLKQHKKMPMESLIKNYGYADYVNDLWRYTPSVFRFAGNDECGDSVVSSPIWIRPNSLSRDGINMNQIVGHTTVQKINPPEGDRAEFWLIDALGTSKEYLIVDDNTIKISKL